MEKIKEVFSDEVFVESLFTMETVSEVQAALQEKGIVLKEEEILAVRDLLARVECGDLSTEQLEQWREQAENRELSEEILEQVAGGMAIGLLITVIVGCVAAAAGGAAGGIKLYYYMNDKRGW